MKIRDLPLPFNEEKMAPSATQKNGLREDEVGGAFQCQINTTSFNSVNFHQH